MLVFGFGFLGPAEHTQDLTGLLGAPRLSLHTVTFRVGIWGGGIGDDSILSTHSKWGRGSGLPCGRVPSGKS